MFSRWKRGGRLGVLDGALPACDGGRPSATAPDLYALVRFLRFVVVGVVLLLVLARFRLRVFMGVLLLTLLLELALHVKVVPAVCRFSSRLTSRRPRGSCRPIGRGIQRTAGWRLGWTSAQHSVCPFFSLAGSGRGPDQLCQRTPTQQCGTP